jgi:hypothetical protein
MPIGATIRYPQIGNIYITPNPEPLPSSVPLMTREFAIMANATMAAMQRTQSRFQWRPG